MALPSYWCCRGLTDSERRERLQTAARPEEEKFDCSSLSSESGNDSEESPVRPRVVQEIASSPFPVPVPVGVAWVPESLEWIEEQCKSAGSPVKLTIPPETEDEVKSSCARGDPQPQLSAKRPSCAPEITRKKARVAMGPWGMQGGQEACALCGLPRAWLCNVTGMAHDLGKPTEQMRCHGLVRVKLDDELMRQLVKREERLTGGSFHTALQLLGVHGTLNEGEEWGHPWGAVQGTSLVEQCSRCICRVHVSGGGSDRDRVILAPASFLTRATDEVYPKNTVAVTATPLAPDTCLKAALTVAVSKVMVWARSASVAPINIMATLAAAVPQRFPDTALFWTLKDGYYIFVACGLGAVWARRWIESSPFLHQWKIPHGLCLPLVAARSFLTSLSVVVPVDHFPRCVSFHMWEMQEATGGWAPLSPFDSYSIECNKSVRTGLFLGGHHGALHNVDPSRRYLQQIQCLSRRSIRCTPSRSSLLLGPASPISRGAKRQSDSDGHPLVIFGPAHMRKAVLAALDSGILETSIVIPPASTRFMSAKAAYLCRICGVRSFTVSADGLAEAKGNAESIRLLQRAVNVAVKQWMQAVQKARLRAIRGQLSSELARTVVDLPATPSQRKVFESDTAFSDSTHPSPPSAPPVFEVLSRNNEEQQQQAMLMWTTLDDYADSLKRDLVAANASIPPTFSPASAQLGIQVGDSVHPGPGWDSNMGPLAPQPGCAVTVDAIPNEEGHIVAVSGSLCTVKFPSSRTWKGSLSAVRPVARMTGKVTKIEVGLHLAGGAGALGFSNAVADWLRATSRGLNRAGRPSCAAVSVTFPSGNRMCAMKLVCPSSNVLVPATTHRGLGLSPGPVTLRSLRERLVALAMETLSLKWLAMVDGYLLHEYLAILKTKRMHSAVHTAATKALNQILASRSEAQSKTSDVELALDAIQCEAAAAASSADDVDEDPADLASEVTFQDTDGDVNLMKVAAGKMVYSPNSLDKIPVVRITYNSATRELIAVTAEEAEGQSEAGWKMVLPTGSDEVLKSIAAIADQAGVPHDIEGGEERPSRKAWTVLAQAAKTIQEKAVANMTEWIQRIGAVEFELKNMIQAARSSMQERRRLRVLSRTGWDWLKSISQVTSAHVEYNDGTFRVEGSDTEVSSALEILQSMSHEVGPTSSSLATIPGKLADRLLANNQFLLSVVCEWAGGKCRASHKGKTMCLAGSEGQVRLVGDLLQCDGEREGRKPIKACFLCGASPEDGDGSWHTLLCGHWGHLNCFKKSLKTRSCPADGCTHVMSLRSYCILKDEPMAGLKCMTDQMETRLAEDDRVLRCPSCGKGWLTRGQKHETVVCTECGALHCTNVTGPCKGAPHFFSTCQELEAPPRPPLEHTVAAPPLKMHCVRCLQCVACCVPGAARCLQCLNSTLCGRCYTAGCPEDPQHHLVNIDLSAPFARLHRTPERCPKGHEMVISSFAASQYSKGWMCEMCNRSDDGHRWFCMLCSSDYCLECCPPDDSLQCDRHVEPSAVAIEEAVCKALGIEEDLIPVDEPPDQPDPRRSQSEEVVTSVLRLLAGVESRDDDHFFRRERRGRGRGRTLLSRAQSLSSLLPGILGQAFDESSDDLLE
eukprot:Sspe_Gene.53013::Locus_29337_Transcript_1_1_Confidence_1.000_Length_5136::g.53013::m.53013